MGIAALVATVISEYEVAFTAGSAAGVERGDIATVFRTIDVTDPASGKQIGQIRRSAARFEITEVQDNLSIGQTFETTGAPLGSLSVLLPGPQRVRIAQAGEGSTADFRTVFVARGAEVDIVHPERKGEEDQ